MAERLKLFFWVFFVLLPNPAKSQLDELFFNGFKGVDIAGNLSLNGAAHIQDTANKQNAETIRPCLLLKSNPIQELHGWQSFYLFNVFCFHYGPRVC